MHQHRDDSSARRVVRYLAAEAEPMKVPRAFSPRRSTNRRRDTVYPL